MPNTGRSRNVLTLLLIVVAVLFSLSAWLYYLATIRLVQASEVTGESAGAALLMTFFRDYGTAALCVELFLLAIMVCVVILTDGHWPRGGN